MQMIDVLKKLREISEKSPEVAKAMENVTRMNTPVAEDVSIQMSGEDAVLAQILKLAGMIGAQAQIDMASMPGQAPMDPMGGMGTPDPMGGMGAPDPMGGMDMPAPEMPGAELPSIHGMPSDGGKPGLPSIDVASPDVPTGDDMGMDDTGMDDMGGVAAAEGSGERPYTNSPREMTKGISAAIPAGDDLNKPKLTAPKVAGGDNPMQRVAVSFD